MDYTTQMDAARKGIITEQMKAVAEYENIPAEEIKELVAKGQVAIPANKNHTCLKPYGIGTRLKTKINVNLGTSKDCLDLNVEMEKVKEAVGGIHYGFKLFRRYPAIPHKAYRRVQRHYRHRTNL